MLVNKEKKRVVIVGGGTGMYTILKGLKRYVDQVDLTAIITMADSGGSTGRLRDEFGQLPIGDVRMALAALAANVDAHGELVRELFLYRFAKGGGLSGHNFGNLLLTALTDILGNEIDAIAAAARILLVQGQVIPVTTDNVHLWAEYNDGKRVVGEHAIDAPPAGRAAYRIVDLGVTPMATINPVAVTALTEADMIILGPGDLYTGILANAVVTGFSEAIESSRASLLYVANLMSRTGQTIGMTASDYVAEIQRYIGRSPDLVLVNDAPFPEELILRYAKEGNHPVTFNCLTGLCNIRTADLLAREPIVVVTGDKVERSLLRHDSDRLAQIIMQLI